MTMLRPMKHSHPDKTVLYLSVQIVKRLKSKRMDEFESLKKFAKKSVKGGEFLFHSALNFVFLLGLIEYHPKTDSFEYVGSK